MLIEITYNVTDVFMSTTETPVYVEISFEQPGGTSAVWGSITGTLSDQTDLQNALNAKLDESTIDGGTEGQILSKASGTDFDFAWINNYAKYLATNARNQTGSTIAAFQVVYISGATGNKPLISLADADTEATSSKTYGVTATSIANNGTGDVVTAGELSGINTSAFNEGDLLWLSTTAGGVVTTPPAEPAHAVFIGYVVRSHPTLGVIDVAIANGYELNELHGVQITTPTDNQGLFYNSTSTLWENKSITTALGYTPVPTTRNITINGVTYDLSADRTWTIAAGLSGTIATGQVAFGTAADTIGGSNNLFWDNANNRLKLNNGDAVISGDTSNLSIGRFASVSNNTVTIWANQNGGIPLLIKSYNNNSVYTFNSNGEAIFSGYIRLRNAAAVAGIGLAVTSAGAGYPAVNIYGNASQTANLLEFKNSAGSIISGFNSAANLFLGSSSDLGVRLGVVGDTLLRGSGNTSATTALTVQNSSSSNLQRILNDGTHKIGNENIDIFPTANGTSVSINGRGLIISTNATSQSTGAVKIVGTSSVASDNNWSLWLTHSFTPLSGTATHSGILLNQTINQTGGANGITRGLYVNPTLTAAADFRAIETTAGNVLFGASGTGFFWDNTNGNLGIGTNSISATDSISIVGSSAARKSIVVQNTNSAGNASFYFQNNRGSFASYGGLLHGGSTYASVFFGVVASDKTILLSDGTSSGGMLVGTLVNTDLTFGTNNLTRARIFGSTGNLSIGTASDLAVRLGVVGDTLLRGSGATSATTALTVQNSSSTNLFVVQNDGGVGIGTTTLNSSALRVNRAVTGNATQSSIVNNSTINSDVTTAAWMYLSSPTTQATAFTLSEVVHFNAFNLTIGAGSTVTNQFGFRATSSLTAATNNFGFYGDIASGTGRWNLYMNGTADNYLAGNIGIGITPTVKLHVSGDTILRGSGATSATTALTVQNSSSTNLFTVRNDGFVNITNTLASSLSVNSSNFTTRILINNTNATPNAGFELQTNGVTNWALANYKPTGTTNASFVFYNQRTSTDSFFIDGDTNNVGIRTNAPTARLDIPASVTTAASLRIRSGTAPTTPNDGDIWFDGTDIKMRIGGVTKTFTLI